MYNLKEIAVKCETVEQKKLVSKIMSEELGCEEQVNNSPTYLYLFYSNRSNSVISIADMIFFPNKIIPYSEFIKHYPKYLIQSGDIVDSSDYGLMRVILFQDELVLINDSNWIPLNSHDDHLRYSSVVKIIRPNSIGELARMEGTTIWQRKSEAEIKREEIQSQIDKLKEELKCL